MLQTTNNPMNITGLTNIYIYIYIYIQVEPGKPGAEVSKKKNIPPPIDQIGLGN